MKFNKTLTLGKVVPLECHTAFLALWKCCVTEINTYIVCIERISTIQAYCISLCSLNIFMFYKRCLSKFVNFVFCSFSLRHIKYTLKKFICSSDSFASGLIHLLLFSKWNPFLINFSMNAHSWDGSIFCFDILFAF